MPCSPHPSTTRCKDDIPRLDVVGGVMSSAVRSAMETLKRQYHSAHFERQQAVRGPDVARSLWLQSWEFYVNCFGHHGHNALKWGVFFL